MILKGLFALSLATGCQPPTHLLSYGDSKTVMVIASSGTNNDAWQSHMEAAFGPCGPRFDVGSTVNTPGALARGSHTVAELQDLIDQDLSVLTAFRPPYAVLINMGSVELVEGLPLQAAFEADYAYILDAMHTKWPNAKLYCHRPWRQQEQADADTIATWIGNVLATRGTFAFLGPDEGTWAKGADDGATMMYDGLHYTHAGSVECHRQWRTILGF